MRRYPAKSAAARYGDRIRIGPNDGLHVRVDLADIAAVAHVLTTGADGNNVIGIGDGDASARAQCEIAVAYGVVS